MDKDLRVQLSQTYDHKPLATVRNLPAPDSDLTPAQLRALAAALKKAATDCEAQALDAKHYRPTERSYPLIVKPSSTKKGRAG
jgi:hypothetical protein